MADPRVRLTVDQERVVDRVVSAREHTMMVGPAGTGKSLVIQRVAHLVGCRGGHAVVLTPSNQAAANLPRDVNSMTWHAALGVNPMKIKRNDTGFTYYKARAMANYLAEMWRDRVTHVVVEEMSMVSARFVRFIMELVCAVRGGTPATFAADPFSSLTWLFAGDPLQLPPVPDVADPDPQLLFDEPAIAEALRTRQIAVVGLLRAFRQCDARFASVVQHAGVGAMRVSDWEYLQGLYETTPERTRGLDLTRVLHVMGRRVDVQAHNEACLDRIPPEVPAHTFPVTPLVLAGAGHPRADAMLAHLQEDTKRIAQPRTLRAGMSAMLVATLDPHLFPNGTFGVVVGFTPRHGHAVFSSDPTVMPDADRVMGRAALAEHEMGDRGVDVPYVVDETTMVVPPFRRTRESVVAARPRAGLPETTIAVAVEFMPIMPAYAVTIHTLQGAGRAALMVDLTRRQCFAEGSLYVAISRATDPGHLYIANMDVQGRVCLTNRRAVEFYRTYARDVYATMRAEYRSEPPSPDPPVDISDYVQALLDDDEAEAAAQSLLQDDAMAVDPADHPESDAMSLLNRAPMRYV